MKSIPASARIVNLFTEPNRCIILGIDPGARSGVACLVSGSAVHLAWSESVASESRSIRDQIVWKAVKASEQCLLPIAVVMETWTGHGAWGAKAQMGLGESAGRWLDSVETVAPHAKVIRVIPQTWRRVLAGLPHKRSADAKDSARLFVASRYGGDACEATADEAEAIAIATWGTRSPEVAEAIRVKRGARR